MQIRKNRILKKLQKYTKNNTWVGAQEVMDITRTVRELYNELELDVLESDERYVEALNFRSFKTPSVWHYEATNQVTSLLKLIKKEWTLINIEKQINHF